MAKLRKHRIEQLDADDSGLWSSNMLAEEEGLDRKAWWRLGSWGVGAVAAITLAILANQRSTGVRGEQVAAADLLRQSRQLQGVTKEAQGETQRLASAVNTLNSDRDRLYARLTVVEQNLESVTGSLNRQRADIPTSQIDGRRSALAPKIAMPETKSAEAMSSETKPSETKSTSDTKSSNAQADARAVSSPSEPPDSTRGSPAKSAVSSRSELNADGVQSPQAKAEPALAASSQPDWARATIETKDQAAPALTTPDSAQAAVTPPGDTAQTTGQAVAGAPSPSITAAQRTEFGIDLGGAPTIEGLRSLWFRTVASNAVLAPLQPIIVVKEFANKPATELRLVAGPLNDAAAAAKICAVLAEQRHPCATSVFDGQRLPIAVSYHPPTASPVHRRRLLRGKPAIASPSAAKPVQPSSAIVGIR